MPQDKVPPQITPQVLPSSYEPPRVELVLTQEDLQRECLFAGRSGGF